MYCHRCDEEYPARARYCKTCGGALEERQAAHLLADLARTRFLLGEMEKWQAKGLLTQVVVEELARPYHKRVAALEEAEQLAIAAAVPQVAIESAPESAPDPQGLEALAPAPVVEQPVAEAAIEPQPAAEIEPEAATHEALEPEGAEPQPCDPTPEASQEHVP